MDVRVESKNETAWLIAEEMSELFDVKRQDVVKHVNKIINSKYKGISPFDNYGENAGIIQQYMFYYAITHKNKI